MYAVRSQELLVSQWRTLKRQGISETNHFSGLRIENVLISTTQSVSVMTRPAIMFFDGSFSMHVKKTRAWNFTRHGKLASEYTCLDLLHDTKISFKKVVSKMLSQDNRQFQNYSISWKDGFFFLFIHFHICLENHLLFSKSDCFTWKDVFMSFGNHCIFNL